MRPSKMDEPYIQCGDCYELFFKILDPKCKYCDEIRVCKGAFVRFMQFQKPLCSKCVDCITKRNCLKCFIIYFESNKKDIHLLTFLRRDENDETDTETESDADDEDEKNKNIDVNVYKKYKTKYGKNLKPLIDNPSDKTKIVERLQTFDNLKRVSICKNASTHSDPFMEDVLTLSSDEYITISKIFSERLYDPILIARKYTIQIPSKPIFNSNYLDSRQEKIILKYINNLYNLRHHLGNFLGTFNCEININKKKGVSISETGLEINGYLEITLLLKHVTTCINATEKRYKNLFNNSTKCIKSQC